MALLMIKLSIQIRETSAQMPKLLISYVGRILLSTNIYPEKHAQKILTPFCLQYREKYTQGHLIALKNKCSKYQRISSQFLLILPKANTCQIVPTILPNQYSKYRNALNDQPMTSDSWVLPVIQNRTAILLLLLQLSFLSQQAEN